ncbi:MAG: hypothetical protein CM15mP102_19840 [Flavobacteriales bacterium]|nr:MAG: hypothetical protein CM15mP102_19840 [Flavobacteriales bacterium]
MYSVGLNMFKDSDAEAKGIERGCSLMRLIMLG